MSNLRDVCTDAEDLFHTLDVNLKDALTHRAKGKAHVIKQAGTEFTCLFIAYNDKELQKQFRNALKTSKRLLEAQLVRNKQVNITAGISVGNVKYCLVGLYNKQFDLLGKETRDAETAAHYCKSGEIAMRRTIFNDFAAKYMDHIRQTDDSADASSSNHQGSSISDCNISGSLFVKSLNLNMRQDSVYVVLFSNGLSEDTND